MSAPVTNRYATTALFHRSNGHAPPGRATPGQVLVAGQQVKVLFIRIRRQHLLLADGSSPLFAVVSASGQLHG